MLNGKYYQPTIFHFGKEAELEVGTEVRKHGRNVLLHYGRESIHRIGLYDRIKGYLAKENLTVHELGGVEPNPRTDKVYEGIDLCRKHDIDLILAVGGGSVVDSAKAIAVGVPYNGDFFDLFEKKVTPEAALKLGVVLTLPGSGSESSPATVISRPETNNKNVCDTPLLYPVFSILNPEFTKTIPPFQTSCGIVDALSHLFERYFSNTEYVEVSDRICEGLIKVLLKYAPLIKDDPENYDYRAEIMWACKLAHDATPGFGRKQDWACHKISHEISAIYDTPHGATMGVVYLAWMRWVRDVNIAKLGQFSERVFDLPKKGEETATVQEGIDRFRNFLDSIDMPTSLQQLGIEEKQHFDTIATQSVRFMESGTIGNFVRLAPKDIIDVLNLSF